MSKKEALILENYPNNPGTRNDWEGCDQSYDLALIAHRRHILGEVDMRQLNILQTPGHRIITVEQLDLARYGDA